MKKYLFTSARLGFREWTEADKLKMHLINSNPEVMKHFPTVLSKAQTNAFIDRMNVLFSRTGFCYFAVDRLDTNAFIGFIGLAEKDFEADFTPCVDIGWRLDKKQWGKGYATEGAKRCLEYAFHEIALKEVIALCPVTNENSEQVMKKIGMQKVKHFHHPLLAEYKHLEECVLYAIDQEKV